MVTNQSELTLPAHNDWGIQIHSTNAMAIAKRFSAVELSAEFWRARSSSQIRVYLHDEERNIVDIHGVGWEYEYEVLLRFATLPHYDEEE